MGTTVKCKECNRRVIYDPSDVASLGEHLLEQHPKTFVTYFTIDDERDRALERKKRKRKRKMYKTTVETWRPGAAPLQCPICNKSGQPLIRKQRNKVTHSSLGALCLLGCWPVCFLPFILGGTNMMNLYCKYCGELMGTYDRKTGHLQSGEGGAIKDCVFDQTGCHDGSGNKNKDGSSKNKDPDNISTSSRLSSKRELEEPNNDHLMLWH